MTKLFVLMKSLIFLCVTEFIYIQKHVCDNSFKKKHVCNKLNDYSQVIIKFH